MNTGVDEEVEDPPLHREAATEDVTFDVAHRGGEVLRVVDEGEGVVGADGEVEHHPRLRGPATSEALFEIDLVEGEKSLHLLGELEVVPGLVRGGHRATSAVERIPSATWSANAAMVKDGFGPTGPGMAAPSTT